jgi:hypothetical protein
MDELSLGEVMNEASHRSPLLCRAVEDGYGQICGFSWLIGDPIVSKLELEPRKDDALRKPLFLNRMSLHIERRFPVDRPNPCDVLRKPLFLSMSLHIERRFSWLIAGPIVSKLKLLGFEPPMSEDRLTEGPIVSKLKVLELEPPTCGELRKSSSLRDEECCGFSSSLPLPT